MGYISPLVERDYICKQEITKLTNLVSWGETMNNWKCTITVLCTTPGTRNEYHEYTCPEAAMQTLERYISFSYMPDSKYYNSIVTVMGESQNRKHQICIGGRGYYHEH